MKKMIETDNLKLHNKRLYKKVDTLNIADELDKMAEKFKGEGWKVQRSPIGIVILELMDGFVYYVPAAGGIEELLFEKVKEGSPNEEVRTS